MYQKLNMLFLTGKKPRTKAPKIQRLVTPRVLQHKRRRIALKKQRTLKNKEEAADYTKLLAKRMKVRSVIFLSSCGSVVRALHQQCKGCGFDSQGTHILTIQIHRLNAL